MREVAFIKQNKEKWLAIERIIQENEKKNPDELSRLYINLINDLSFAQTYYPKSKVTVYLNDLSAQIFQKVYKTKRIEKNRFWAFFSEEVPLLVYKYRTYLAVAFLFFALFVGVGVLSSIYDKEFAQLILGTDYVHMTIENIEKDNAVGVYQSGSNWGTAIMIIFNNLIVGAKLYLYGVFFCVGTLYALMNNSIMLGTFQYFFVEHGALKESAKGIWIHGIFEIFAMVIEAMAGLILGASFLFPKTFSRIESLKRGFKDSFKIFVSTIPFTIVAGILEGFVTRYALKMPTVLNAFILISCALIIVFYYLIYPRIVYNKLLPKN